MFNGKQYAPGEKPSSIFTDKQGQYFYIRTGVIEGVDFDKYEMKVRWEPGNAVRNKIPISFPYASPAGCMGMLPEQGTMGIFGFYNTGTGGGTPLCLGYLPAGLGAGLNYDRVKINPDALPSSDINEIEYKFRKLGEGDMNLSSPLGSTVFLNQNVEIHDSAQDKIMMREADQSIITTSLSNFIFSDGASVSAGPAIRNAKAMYDDRGKKLPNNASLLSLPEGLDNIYIVPFGEDITYDTQFYTEYRIDVDELGNGKLDLNDINSQSPLSTRDPIVTMAMGNYIGADRRNIQQYGEILKVNLFLAGNALRGKFGLAKAVQNNGLDETLTLGLAYALHFPKSKSFFGVDKEGHYYINLSASSSKKVPLGAGRSMSILAQGNLKEIWGATAKENNSWDLATVGGIRWDIGAHNTKGEDRSIDITTSSGINIKVKGADAQGYARQETFKGNTFEYVGGKKEVSALSSLLDIVGLKEEQVGGSSTEIVQSDKSVNVGGVYSETVTKEKQCKFGSRKTTITLKGSDELEVMGGNIIETISTFGQKKLSVNAKNVEQIIGMGVYETKMKIGQYKVNVNSGTIEIKTSIGTISISGTSVDIKGSVLVNIVAPMVKIGKGAPIGGVISGLPGIPSHADYVTGAPLKGSFKVSVSA